MSLFKFGDFEAEVDFMDADFLETLEEAKRLLSEKEKQVPKTGQVREIILAEVAASDIFFDTLFGEGAGVAIRNGRNSVKVCLEAMDALRAVESDDADYLNQTREKYAVQEHGNRQQRRQYNKQNSKNYNRNQGKK